LNISTKYKQKTSDRYTNDRLLKERTYELRHTTDNLTTDKTDEDL